MDEFFKNNPNLFQNVNVDAKHSSFKGRQKMSIYNNNNNNNNQLNYNKNQGRTSYKNIKNILREMKVRLSDFNIHLTGVSEEDGWVNDKEALIR